MTYYTSPHDETVPMLLELLAAEADASPAWTLQGLLALCRETSFLDEQPQCADHFDSVYLVLAELFVQFQQTGRLSGPPEALTKVGSFTLDAAAQQEVTAALAALQSGQIEGRPRKLTQQWQQEGSWPTWQQQIAELAAAIRQAQPTAASTSPAADRQSLAAGLEGQETLPKKRS